MPFAVLMQTGVCMLKDSTWKAARTELSLHSRSYLCYLATLMLFKSSLHNTNRHKVCAYFCCACMCARVTSTDISALHVRR